jgi:hypothetical protein
VSYGSEIRRILCEIEDRTGLSLRLRRRRPSERRREPRDNLAPIALGVTLDLAGKARASLGSRPAPRSQASGVLLVCQRMLLLPLASTT